MQSSKSTPLFLLSFFIFTSAFAGELKLSREQALKQGFQSRPQLAATTIGAGTESPSAELERHELDWPVEFIDSRHTIGNSMPQYQNYGTEAYFHGGSDLRVARSQAVYTPVDGYLTGFYYSYVTDPQTGEDQKFTKPITSGGQELYFEINIRMENGYQLELHHVSPRNLPQDIYNMIVRGGGQVKKGDLVGYTVSWPVLRYGDRYDHIHYNLVSPQGVKVNPEYFSKALHDDKAPVIKNIFAIYPDKKVEVRDQTLVGRPQELVISAYDMKGDNIYPLPPVLVQASSEPTLPSVFTVAWDFTQKLVNQLGGFPDIREVYARNLRLSDGRLFTTQGDYRNTEFLFRLKLPATYDGPITILVKDSSDNETRVTLQSAR
ncbi:hypothetical protein [Pseudobdellovibrio exovorus]|uniref:Uncharacterized protein n=1 Tax=Pseudobdellovibrio exovorus JSS TaxID=1184267 RepID=M4V827_9BACT|nr:hypothetical protein [Pseudobdellovibrio exovorus]AGH94595.1 hypothetical protein A11Q_375 [Pseudobdellovibrio exovorus JSS]